MASRHRGQQPYSAAAAAALAAASGPSVQNARDYVARVKSALGPTSPQYRYFLDTLKGYRTRVISPQEVIQRVSELFRGRRSLILGFNAFLPGEFQIREVQIPMDEAPAVVIMDEEEEEVVAEDDDEHVDEHVDEPATTSKMVIEDKSDENDEEEEEDSAHHHHRKDAAQDPQPCRKREEEDDVTHHYHHRHHREEAAQDPQPRSRKRLRVRLTASKDVSRNIKVTTTPAITKDTETTPPVPIIHKNKINSTTQILLSPPKLQPSDRLHDYNPIKDGEFTEIINLNTDHVNCKLCGGNRDSAAIENNEPVLLCEQKGCNAEYHLGCLYNYRPALFPNNMYINANDTAASSKNDDEDDNPPQCELSIPEGDIFCTQCASSGATTVLEKYLDKIDYERSHYSCSRAYVYVLLEKHMKENPHGNVVERSLAQEKAGIGEVRLRSSPRSELWYAGELSRQALLLLGKETDDDDAVREVESSAELLVGKPVRLYNNLDNEYHVGRIVDWRTCTVYTPIYDNNGSGNDSDDGPPVSKSNTVQMKDLEYYGTSPLSTSEFLVRFPSGLQGRKKELLRWIVLEEHSLAVGVSLIQGRTSKSKGGSSGSRANNGGWKPAMILARSALELVTVRQFLHEDDDGNLFAEMKIKGGNRYGGDGKKKDDRWALASFFGEEQHALLRLRDEARDLLVDVVTDKTDKNSLHPNSPSDEEEGTNVQPDHPSSRRREPLASVDVPMGLALAEHSEQERCKEWCQLILQKSAHKRALVASNEYSMQLNLEKEEANNGSGRVTGEETNGKPKSAVSTNNYTIRPLVERGMDRLWLARLVEKVSQEPIQRSKDTLMSFKCENVSSVSDAMASLQRQ